MLERKFRLNKKQEYKKVFAKGFRYVSRLVVVYIVKGRSVEQSQIGFIASKKVGNAVKRNRAKRLMREVVRQKKTVFKGPCLMVCIARSAITRASFDDVEKSLCYMWKKGGIL
ncbi:MAG: ribonuclease P protein component [Peptococcaceae bacterium]|nr:ribonuclease P protein component [Peptococcaceae bacterium]